MMGLALYPIKNSKVNLQSSVIGTSDFTKYNVTEQFEKENSEVAENNDIKITSNTPIVEVSKAPYILVGGSFSYFENAVSIQNKLTNNGYHSEIMELESGLFRVIIDSYKTKEEAKVALNNYNKKHGSGAWIGKR